MSVHVSLDATTPIITTTPASSSSSPSSSGSGGGDYSSGCGGVTNSDPYEAKSGQDPSLDATIPRRTSLLKTNRPPKLLAVPSGGGPPPSSGTGVRGRVSRSAKPAAGAPLSANPGHRQSRSDAEDVLRDMRSRSVPSSPQNYAEQEKYGSGFLRTQMQQMDARLRDHAESKNNDEDIQWKKGGLIGSGSFGKVFMGMNTLTGELIAIKQVKVDSKDKESQLAQFESEIQLMRQLRHPNIVCLLGTQKQGRKLNIIMEYVPGSSLDALLDKFGALKEKVIKTFTRQILEALDYCHSHNVVHRDIKGKNILVDKCGTLKLADFGSAKQFENAMSNDAPSMNYNYTPLWTAPEVLKGDYNQKIDIWSTGCVMIEMATADKPWAEENFENPFRALYHIGNSEKIPVIPENLSDLGKEFLRLCLCRDPDNRPTAAELLVHPWLNANMDECASPLHSQGIGPSVDFRR